MTDAMTRPLHQLNYNEKQPFPLSTIPLISQSSILAKSRHCLIIPFAFSVVTARRSSGKTRSFLGSAFQMLHRLAMNETKGTDTRSFLSPLLITIDLQGCVQSTAVDVLACMPGPASWNCWIKSFNKIFFLLLNFLNGKKVHYQCP